eukprot:Pompholyxophrys_punicea_v1_NODE_80_length_3711_cov_3.592724.p4 type:complete len:163 gc:universal NODE_80_length_3711_cov_3.592724:1623-2111(+)
MCYRSSLPRLSARRLPPSYSAWLSKRPVNTYPISRMALQPLSWTQSTMPPTSPPSSNSKHTSQQHNAVLYLRRFNATPRYSPASSASTRTGKFIWTSVPMRARSIADRIPSLKSTTNFSSANSNIFATLGSLNAVELCSTRFPPSLFQRRTTPFAGCLTSAS